MPVSKPVGYPSKGNKKRGQINRVRTSDLASWPDAELRRLSRSQYIGSGKSRPSNLATPCMHPNTSASAINTFIPPVQVVL